MISNFYTEKKIELSFRKLLTIQEDIRDDVLVNVLNIYPCEMMVIEFYTFMKINYHLCLGPWIG
jgi:hypothetical protein